jgi:formylglycine-generating enzyme required for sulfatase activity
MALTIGTNLAGHYRIIDELGSGGFGKTYIAEDIHLPGNPKCVVKQLELLRNYLQNYLQIARQLFQTEAEVLYQLGTHAQIPRLLAYFEENQEFYIVEEFIEGHDLGREIAPGKKLSESYVIKLLQDVLEILAFAHQKNVIHRDIKPQNIRRRNDGKIFLVNFGALIQKGIIPGYPWEYNDSLLPMPPPYYRPAEQAHGARGKPKLSSDIYAVGIIGIQALTGLLPTQLLKYPGIREEIVWRDGVQVNPKLADILDQMVRYDFRQRYPSAVEALQAISSLPNPLLAKTLVLPPSQLPALPTIPLIQTLKVFRFEVITLNAKGEIINRQPQQAEYFAEDLGNGVSLEMVSIPGGTFMMGSPETEEGREYSESPQHQVTIAPFFIGKYLVTQEQHYAVMEEKRKKKPVEYVYWDTANEFCQKLSQKTGKKYRLPSEAEWEYACRAGTTTPFHFGETITTEVASHSRKYNEREDYLSRLTDVGSFPPNNFGLYDMHGNVWEWCADAWHDNYQGAPSDGSVWGDSYGHVRRGGSWSNSPNYCRSACRDYFSDDQDYLICCGGNGFRVVISA